MSETPRNEPATLRAGDTIAWTRAVPDYTADSWTLKYQARGQAGGFTITAAADGAEYLVTVPAATSAAYPPGRYRWVAWVEAGSNKHTVATGEWDVLPDLRTADVGSPFDGRSQARRTLDAIEAVIENRATTDQMAYSIAGRSLQRMSVADLLLLRDRYKGMVQAEVAADRLASGMGGARRLLVRL